MKPIRKTQPVRGKRAIQSASPAAHRARIVGKALRETFEHPFHVEYRDDQTIIEWDCGPRRESVWGYLIYHFPKLAGENIIRMMRQTACDIYDGYIAVPIPFSLKRRDLFNASVVDIPRLVMAGADLEEEDAGGTPLLNAVMRRDDARALALATAGANLDDFGPSGHYWFHTCDLPAFHAYVESLLLETTTPMAALAERRIIRL